MRSAVTNFIGHKPNAMLRTRPVLLAAIVLHTSAWGQHIFVEGHGTYQFPLGGISSATSSTSGSVRTSKHVLFNFGTGAGFGVLVGGTINPYLGWEARISHLTGAEQKASSYYDYVSSRVEDDWSFNNRYLAIEPAIRLRTPGERVHGYIALGPSLVVGAEMSYESRYTYTSYPLPDPMYYSTHTEHRREVYTGHMGWGAFGAVGLVRQGKGAIGFFGEVNFAGRSWAPAKGEETVEESHTDQTGSWATTTTTTVTYVDEYTSSEPDKQLKFHYPMSTWGFRAGIRFLFGRTKEE